MEFATPAPTQVRSHTNKELDQLVPPHGTDLNEYLPRIQKEVSWVDFILLTQKIIEQSDRVTVINKIEEGAGEKCLFLPFTGEFGWLIMWAVRLVHYSKASYKIVCCPKGFECLFPSANEFYTDWKNPIPDELRGGTHRDETLEWPEITALYPDAKPIKTVGLSFSQEKVIFCPGYIKIEPRIKRNLQVDICIGTRKRGMTPSNNYQQWPEIAAYLSERGLTFAIIGNEDSSFPLLGSKYMSGDFGGIDGAVELLQNCKLFLGTDSGGAHLAALCAGCDMVVHETPTMANGEYPRRFIARMISSTMKKVTVIPRDEWDSPSAFIKIIDEYFDKK